jgi:hypothetical protein
MQESYFSENIYHVSKSFTRKGSRVPARMLLFFLLLLFGTLLISCSKDHKNPVESADGQLLVGTWNLVAIRSVSESGNVYDVSPDEIAADPLTYILRSDSTGTTIYQESESEFFWTVQGNKLITTFYGGSQEYLYTVNSTTLTLTFQEYDDESEENCTITHRFTRQSGCPSNTTIKHLEQITIEQWEEYFGEVLLTGAGALAGIEVGPPGENWDGFKITETVTSAPDGDPCGLASAVGKPAGFFCSCDGNPCAAVFTVGAKFAGTPLGVGDAEHNVFWDLHKIPSKTVSLLHYAGLSECTISCIQEYSCNGTVIGRYLITYILTRDDAFGKTRVSVNKTPLVK